MPNIPETVEEWLPCLTLPDYVLMIPTGCIRPVVGPVIWVDGNGIRRTTEQYIERWGFDPQIAWDAIKEYRRRAGKKDKTVVL